MPTYTIETAQPEHLAALPGIEIAAARLFPTELLPSHLRDRVVPAATLAAAQAEGRLWVALAHGGHPVGFAVAQHAGETAFLVEVDVQPDHARRGLGRALIDAVIAWARAEGFVAVTLTTFGQVPWNAPFYEKIGFRRLTPSELTRDLARLMDDEARDGLKDRIAMRLDLRGI